MHIVTHSMPTYISQGCMKTYVHICSEFLSTCYHCNITMRILDLPFSFISQSGNVKILLTTVGLRVPAAFHKVSEYLQETIDTIDLDVSSIGNVFLDVKGQIHCSVHVCENSDSLEFLLSLTEPNLPHLSYHVAVGVAIAESIEEILKCSKDFDDLVHKTNQNCIPCLYVFAPQGYDGTGLPFSVTQIPGNADEEELRRCIKQGFYRCLMQYLNGLGPIYDELQVKIDQPASLIKMGSLHFIVGAYSHAASYYERALKQAKNDHLIQSQVIEQALNKRLNIKIDKSMIDTSLPQPLSNVDLTGWRPEAITALSYIMKSKNIVAIIQTVLRIVPRVPLASRRYLLLYAMSFTKPQPTHQYFKYHVLATMLLKQSGFERTFMYQASLICNTGFIKSYILKPFTDTLTSGTNWCVQRVKPAIDLFKSQNVPRVIKNDLMKYLLKNIHKIHDSQAQKELISLIPSTLTVDLNTILNVGELELQENLSPIEESLSRTNSLFIYNALDKGKKKNRKLICSVGEQISFLLKLSNPLSIVFPIDVCLLEASNAIATPVVCGLSPNRTQYIPLTLTAQKEGELAVTGFRLVSGQIIATHKLANPIVFTTIGKMPTLNIRLPFRTQPTLYENGETYVSFEMINTSDVEVHLKGVKFPPPPAIQTPDSLPIIYPPEVIPPLPDTLAPGKSFNFKIKMIIDQSLSDLSFAVEYGTEKYTRRFAYSQPLTILEGPHIDRIQVIPMDNHDDFMGTSNLVMVVIRNPFELPIEVQGEDQTVVVAARSYGTYLVHLDTINAQIDPEAKSFTCDGIDKEHVRKCEQAMIIVLKRPLEREEQLNVWRSLLIKSRIQEQLKLRWVNQDGLEGILPFTHVSLDAATMMLMQPPPFNVEFQMRRKSAKIWILTTNIKSDTPITVKSTLSFTVEGAGTGVYHVFTAGIEENTLVSPGSFETALHATDVGDLKVVGKFFVGSAIFTRISSFTLSKFKLEQ